MDKYLYTILNIIFFAPIIILGLLFYRKIIIKRIQFITFSGLLGILYFFIVDLPAIHWNAWDIDYSKTLGVNFSGSVLEELVWVSLIFMTIASIIEIYLEKYEK